jgi:hypothetical protein
VKHDGFTKVSSDHIAGVKYDSFECRMTVKFHNGAEYAVHSVRPEEYQEFLDAPSQGKHYHQHIKTRFYVEQVK